MVPRTDKNAEGTRCLRVDLKDAHVHAIKIVRLSITGGSIDA